MKSAVRGHHCGIRKGFVGIFSSSMKNGLLARKQQPMGKQGLFICVVGILIVWLTRNYNWPLRPSDESAIILILQLVRKDFETDEVYSFFSVPFIVFTVTSSLPPSRNSGPGSHSRFFSPADGANECEIKCKKPR